VGGGGRHQVQHLQEGVQLQRVGREVLQRLHLVRGGQPAGRVGSAEGQPDDDIHGRLVPGQQRRQLHVERDDTAAGDHGEAGTATDDGEDDKKNNEENDEKNDEENNKEADNEKDNEKNEHGKKS